MANSVAHFEIFASDVKRARAFYERVFGWTFEGWGPPDFFLITTGPKSDPGMTMGALAKREEGIPENPIRSFRCTISVVSIDASVDAIQKAGGTMMSTAYDIPNVGKCAEFMDTEGNIACVMEYDKGTGLSVKS
jgi:uncharacterized protein